MWSGEFVDEGIQIFFFFIKNKLSGQFYGNLNEFCIVGILIERTFTFEI